MEILLRAAAISVLRCQGGPGLSASVAVHHFDKAGIQLGLVFQRYLHNILHAPLNVFERVAHIDQLSSLCQRSAKVDARLIPGNIQHLGIADRFSDRIVGYACRIIVRPVDDLIAHELHLLRYTRGIRPYNKACKFCEALFLLTEILPCHLIILLPVAPIEGRHILDGWCALRGRWAVYRR